MKINLEEMSTAQNFYHNWQINSKKEEYQKKEEKYSQLPSGLSPDYFLP